jgi:membrane protease subunit (stomatin/prohibitin family)
MAFFENLSNKAKTISETSSLNGVIKTEERKISEQIYKLGQLYFEKYGNSPEPEFAEAVSAIKASQATISETQKQIENIQNRYKCPKCGNSFKPGSVFCSVCGYTLSEAPAATQICSKCGNQLPAAAVFCNNCGNRLSQPAPQPVVEAAQPAPQPVVETAQPAPQPAAETAQPVPQPVVETAQPVPQPVVEAAQPAGKICPKCGEKLGADDMFCDVCGSKL